LWILAGFWSRLVDWYVLLFFWGMTMVFFIFLLDQKDETEKIKRGTRVSR